MRQSTFLNVLVEKFTLYQNFQWEDNTTVNGLHKCYGDTVLDNLVQFFRQYKIYLY
jgi:hypothetical protein